MKIASLILRDIAKAFGFVVLDLPTKIAMGIYKWTKKTYFDEQSWFVFAFMVFCIALPIITISFYPDTIFTLNVYNDYSTYFAALAFGFVALAVFSILLFTLGSILVALFSVFCFIVSRIHQYFKDLQKRAK